VAKGHWGGFRAETEITPIDQSWRLLRRRLQRCFAAANCGRLSRVAGLGAAYGAFGLQGQTELFLMRQGQVGGRSV